MKLKDFIIGVGLFGVFTVIIFGMINPDNANGIYGLNYLNITMDDQTKETISLFSDVGDNATQEFGIVKDEIEDFVSNRTAPEVPTEANLMSEGIKILFAVPRFFGTASHGMSEISASLGIPSIFVQWAVGSIVVIIVLMIAAAFFRNRLED